jgi:D-ribose pyranose/furanose isomerase RbsD
MFDLYATKPAAKTHSATVIIEHETEAGDIQPHKVAATGYYSLDHSDYALDTWEHEDLDHLPEELQARIRAGEYNHLFTSALNEAELM